MRLSFLSHYITDPDVTTVLTSVFQGGHSMFYHAPKITPNPTSTLGQDGGPLLADRLQPSLQALQSLESTGASLLQATRALPFCFMLQLPS